MVINMKPTLKRTQPTYFRYIYRMYMNRNARQLFSCNISQIQIPHTLNQKKERKRKEKRREKLKKSSIDVCTTPDAVPPENHNALWVLKTETCITFLIQPSSHIFYSKTFQFIYTYAHICVYIIQIRIPLHIFRKCINSLYQSLKPFRIWQLIYWKTVTIIWRCIGVVLVPSLYLCTLQEHDDKVTPTQQVR